MLCTLREAILLHNIMKYKFNSRSAKHLGFIIKASKSLRRDLEKDKAIKE
jgi:hypothetical protein